MTLLRHTPPCNDPACLPCWWDALDKEMYSRPLVESRLTVTQRLRKVLRRLR